MAHMGHQVCRALAQSLSPTGCKWYICNILSAHLDPLWHSGAVHATRHIHCVPPNIVLRFPGPDHTGDHGSNVQPCHTREYNVILQIVRIVFSVIGFLGSYNPQHALSVSPGTRNV